MLKSAYAVSITAIKHDDEQSNDGWVVVAISSHIMDQNLE